MTRGGRPSARGARKRNLVGPNEILERIQNAGGIPENVLSELQKPKPGNPRAEAANEATVAALRRMGDVLTDKGVNHEMTGPTGSDDPARAMAWLLSVTNAMKMAPKEKWCRHMHAADPNLLEIRTIAILSAGIWKCVECLREAAPGRPNLWPDECDLCGAKSETFAEVSFNVPGCFVNCNVCERCEDYFKSELG